MTDDFEKMDEWMMKASRRTREEKVPQKELDAFHADVMKKITEGSRPGIGMPLAGLIFAGAFAGVVLLGTVFYLSRVQVKSADVPVKAEVTRVPAVNMPVKPVIISTAVQAPPVSAGMNERPDIQVPEVAVNVPSARIADPSISDDEILEEIEALKELGVWSEEDEEEAGIPIETAFLELAGYDGDTQPGVVMAPSARA